MDTIVINGETYFKQIKNSNLSIIRTYSAGVHVGEVVEQHGKEVLLKNARRIWRWYGANTLNEIALHGVDRSQSRISEIVPGPIKITEAIETIPVSEGVNLEPIWSK